MSCGGAVDGSTVSVARVSLLEAETSLDIHHLLPVLMVLPSSSRTLYETGLDYSTILRDGHRRPLPKYYQNCIIFIKGTRFCFNFTFLLC